MSTIVYYKTLMHLVYLSLSGEIEILKMGVWNLFWWKNKYFNKKC